MGDDPETALSELPEHDENGDDLHWANLEIQKAQRQITRGMSELAEGIVGLALILLEVRRRRLYRFDPQHPTFEVFVEQRHGISAQQANMYVDALLSLGPAQYRSLISDIGVQRTYALAMLQRADPALVTAFQRLPPEERRAVTVAHISAVDAAVTSELRTRVAQLEHEVTREQGMLQQARRRLQEVEAIHQRVTGSLIEERDSARQALDQEQAQTERLRQLLATARQASAVPTQPAAAAIPTRSAPAEPAGAVVAGTGAPVSEAVVVVVACDVNSILSDTRALIEKFGRLARVSRADVPPEQRRSLALTLQELEASIQALLRA